MANETKKSVARVTKKKQKSLPRLEPGDHLNQKTFHARYEAMPEDVRAELIGGVVFMPSPLRRPHSRTHYYLLHWFFEYEEATPGTEGHDNATTILGPKSEPQPDACLLITARGLGQTREENEYIVGPPELEAEIASSTVSIDLHLKKTDYEKAGIKEYIVVVLRPARVFWFVNRNGTFDDLQPGADGIFRSEVFPGLWLDPAALLRHDAKRLRKVLRQGLASPEHAAFVTKLASRQRS
jgi:Uma2 family endonuclease